MDGGKFSLVDFHVTVMAKNDFKHIFIHANFIYQERIIQFLKKLCYLSRFQYFHLILEEHPVTAKTDKIGTMNDVSVEIIKSLLLSCSIEFLFSTVCFLNSKFFFNFRCVIILCLFSFLRVFFIIGLYFFFQVIPIFECVVILCIFSSLSIFSNIGLFFSFS